MSHSPPVPEANQSPYPLQEPPHPHHDRGDAQQPVAVDDDGDEEGTLADRLRSLPLATIGAAVGIGAALVGGALLGLRRGWSKPRGRGKAKRS